MVLRKRRRAGGAAAATSAMVLFSVAGPALVSLPGCVEIDGGAVEVAWALFTDDGRAITNCACADPAIAYVRLNLVSDPGGESQPCAGLATCRFACGRKVGATPFVIPPGRYLMSVVAVGEDGMDLAEDLVESPAPQSRMVVRGQPTELDAYMLTVGCATRCGGDDFTRPCSGG